MLQHTSSQVSFKSQKDKKHKTLCHKTSDETLSQVTFVSIVLCCLESTINAKRNRLNKIDLKKSDLFLISYETTSKRKRTDVQLGRGDYLSALTVENPTAYASSNKRKSKIPISLSISLFP